MGCMLEFNESLFKVEFCSKGRKQKILIDILIKYGDTDLNTLSAILGTSVSKLNNICNGTSYLVGEKADSLAQLFLIFFGKKFFRKCTIIRNF